MEAPTANPQGGIHVVLVLRRGDTLAVQIDEEALEDLEYWYAEELPVESILSAWLQVPPDEAPLSARVFGRRRNGADVLIQLTCEDAWDRASADLYGT